jgi:predicted DNA-binding transcriptional regulator AlpA
VKRVAPSPPTPSPQELLGHQSQTERRLAALEVGVAALAKQMDEFKKSLDVLHDERGTVYKSGSGTDGAMSIDEFCQRNHLSRSSFYALGRARLAPRLMKIGRSVRISYEAEKDWQRSMERDPGPQGTDNKC